ncbi:MAG: peptide-methionine (S)-S-oxide reductase [Flavobacteriales bacterium]|jgi:peptide-methionine (S)-S-oxide reductase
MRIFRFFRRPHFMWIHRFFLVVVVSLSGAARAEEASSEDRDTAIFAGGCFWCMEPPFDKAGGVIATTSGYIGGHGSNPSYKQVSRGDTGHFEAVRVTFRPSVINYQQLLQIFWVNIDPFDAKGQFCDTGSPYFSAIFISDEEQRALAEVSKANLQKSLPSTSDIKTQILDAAEFYAAEDYHQGYYQKNPFRYRFYRHGCGRDRRLDELWGKSRSLPFDSLVSKNKE